MWKDREESRLWLHMKLKYAPIKHRMLLRWLSVKSEHRGAEEDSAVCCINTGRTLLMNVTPGSHWWWWFLHLIGLTAEDIGRYTCECIKTDGTFNLHVNVTVKDDVSQKRLNQKEAQTSAKMTNSIYLIGVAVVISGVILGFIFQVKSLWGLFEVRSIRTVCAWNSQLFGTWTWPRWPLHKSSSASKWSLPNTFLWAPSHPDKLSTETVPS